MRFQGPGFGVGGDLGWGGEGWGIKRIQKISGLNCWEELGEELREEGVGVRGITGQESPR